MTAPVASLLSVLLLLAVWGLYFLHHLLAILVVAALSALALGSELTDVQAGERTSHEALSRRLNELAERLEDRAEEVSADDLKLLATRSPRSPTSWTESVRPGET